MLCTACLSSDFTLVQILHILKTITMHYAQFCNNEFVRIYCNVAQKIGQYRFCTEILQSLMKSIVTLYKFNSFNDLLLSHLT